MTSKRCTFKVAIWPIAPSEMERLAGSNTRDAVETGSDVVATAYLMELSAGGDFAHGSSTVWQSMSDAIGAASEALLEGAFDMARIIEVEPEQPARDNAHSLVFWHTLADVQACGSEAVKLDIIPQAEILRAETAMRDVALVIFPAWLQTCDLVNAALPGTRFIRNDGFAAIEAALTAIKTRTLPEGVAIRSGQETVDGLAVSAPTHWFQFGASAPRTVAVCLSAETILVFTGPDSNPELARASDLQLERNLGEHGNAAHRFVRKPAALRVSRCRPATLIPACGKNPSDIIKALRSIEGGLSNGKPLGEISDAARARVGAQRDDLPCRLAIVARDEHHLRKHLARALGSLTHQARSRITHPDGLFYADNRHTIPGRHGKTVLLFPGQGCQYVGMFREQILYCRTIRTWFERLDVHMGEDGILQCRFLHYDDNTSTMPEQLRDTLMSLEGGGVCTIAAELGTFELFKRLGIKADILCGYSNGENAVLFASGMARFDTPDELFERIAQISRDGLRGAHDGDIPTGTVLSITTNNACAAREILLRFNGQIAISTDNSPANFTIFGDAPVIAQLRKAITRVGAVCLERAGERSYHTKFFTPELPSVREVLKSLRLAPPNIPVISCAAADYFSANNKAITELAARQYVETVRFRQTVERLFEDGATTFVDIGPRGQLAGFVRQTLGSRAHVAISVDQPNRSGFVQLLQAVARLYIEGTGLNWHAFHDELADPN